MDVSTLGGHGRPGRCVLGEARVTVCGLPGGDADAVIREDLRPEFRDRIAHDLIAVF